MLLRKTRDVAEVNTIEDVTAAVDKTKAAIVAKRRERAVVAADLRDVVIQRGATTFSKSPAARRDVLRAQQRELEDKLAVIDREIADLGEDLEVADEAMQEAQAAHDLTVATSIAADAAPIAADIMRGLAILVPAIEAGIRLHGRVDGELLTGLNTRVMPAAARAALTTPMLQVLCVPELAHVDSAWLDRRRAEVKAAFGGR